MFTRDDQKHGRTTEMIRWFEWWYRKTVWHSQYRCWCGNGTNLFSIVHHCVFKEQGLGNITLALVVYYVLHRLITIDVVSTNTHACPSSIHPPSQWASHLCELTGSLVKSIVAVWLASAVELLSWGCVESKLYCQAALGHLQYSIVACLRTGPWLPLSIRYLINIVSYQEHEV